MKILFITGLYPIGYEDKLKELSCGIIQNASNVFQWNVVDGFNSLNLDFEVVSCPFLPAYPIRYKNIYTPSSNIIYNERIIGKVLSYNDLICYKTLSIKKVLQKYVTDWVKNNSDQNNLCILTYTPYYPFISSIKGLSKYKSVTIATIVTDLVDNMFYYKSNRTLLKRIQCIYEKYRTKMLYKYIDKFILLSKAMIDYIPEARGKSIVVEGIAKIDHTIKTKQKEKIFNFMYTGTLEEYSGVDYLIDSFMKINNPDIRLTICGSGPLETIVRDNALKDNRIIFKGLLSREDVLILQKKATVLVNPRKPDGKLTKYSFPSKTMEYLSSGTPMIGYKLEGIPSEYFDYFYTVNNDKEGDLESVMQNVTCATQDELNIKAQKAFEFINTRKNSKCQASKIFDFLNAD